MPKAPYYRRIFRPAIEEVNERWLQTWLNTYAVQFSDDGVSVALGGEIIAGSWYPVEQTPVAATVVPTSYPNGYTVMYLSADTSWPADTGLVETYVHGTGGSSYRIHQTCKPKSAGPSFERFAASGSTWDRWRLVAPTVHRIDDTDHAIVGAGYEEAARLSISAYPTTRFEAGVSVATQLYGEDTTATSVNMDCYVEISLDGGSTWSTGQVQTSETGVSASSARQQAFALVHSDSGQVTGTIEVRIMARSGATTTTFYNPTIVAIVGNNY